MSSSPEEDEEDDDDGDGDGDGAEDGDGDEAEAEEEEEDAEAEEDKVDAWDADFWRGVGEALSSFVEEKEGFQGSFMIVLKNDSDKAITQ